MTKTRLPLVMLLGLAALALLSGCGGTAPTPAQAMQEAEGQVPGVVEVTAEDLTATPTPTPTPEPTATPTPTPTPTPEATPTPDAEAIVQRIQEKLSQEQQVYRNDMWRSEHGARAYKNILVWGSLKLTEALGINYDLAQLVKQGHDVRIVWVGKNWWYAQGAWGKPLHGTPAFCVLPDLKYAAKRGKFVAGEIVPLNDTATFFMDDKGVPRSQRNALSSDIFGERGRDGRTGEPIDRKGEQFFIIMVDSEVAATVHMTTVQDREPTAYGWSMEEASRYNIYIESFNIPAGWNNYIKLCQKD